VTALTSDQQGRFRAVGLSPGRYTIFATRGTQWVGNSIPTVDIEAGAETSTTIYLTKPMALLSPAHEATVATTATFGWEPITGTTRYELYVTEVGNTCSVPLSGGISLSPRPVTSTTTSATVTTLVVGKHYTWTVKAVDNNSDLAWYAGSPRCVWVR